MKTFRRILMGIGGLVLAAIVLVLTAPRAAHAVAAALVQVTNTAANPVPVSDVAAQQAFAMSCQNDLSFPDDINECFVPVPAGKRFIIQSVSMHTSTDPGVTVAFGTMVTFNGPSASANIVWLGMPVLSSDRNGFYQAQATQETHAFADGGTNVECSVLYRTDSSRNSLQCSVFGYLTNQP